jgi:hypothetical protein
VIWGGVGLVHLGSFMLGREGMRLMGRLSVLGGRGVVLLRLGSILRRVVALLVTSPVLMIGLLLLLMVLLGLRLRRGQEASWLVLLLAVWLGLVVLGRCEDGGVDGTGSSRRGHDGLPSDVCQLVRWKSKARRPSRLETRSPPFSLLPPVDHRLFPLDKRQ